MENQEIHHHGCTHCGCRNPLIEVLKEELFSADNFAALPVAKAETAKPQPVALMISGGTIRPMINGSVAAIPAIGFASGQVVISGTEREVEEFMTKHHPGFTQRVLAEGQTLLPGLIEPHVHIVPTALLMGWLDLGRFVGQDLREGYGISWVEETIKNDLPNVKAENWLLGTGLDPALMPFKTEMNKTELITIDVLLLDKITTTVPVLILSASMHTLYLNTPALKTVYKSDSNLQGQYPTFEKYVLETKGQLQDAAMYPAFKVIPKPQIAAMFLDCFANLKTLFSTANERGVTFMYDAGMNGDLKKLLDAYLAFHHPVVRIGAAQICSSIKDAAALPSYKEHDRKKYEDVYIGNVKVVSDGSNQGLTGYQSEPYLCHPDHNYGLFNFGKDGTPQRPPDEYVEMLRIVIEEKGWPLMIHANGDLAVRFAIQVYQQYIPNQKTPGLRHRIEHCSLITQEELVTMSDLGISPSFLIGHVGYWGYAFKEAIFGEKAEMLDLCNSALSKGMRISLHSDNQVSPLGPLRMMEQSVTRIMEADPHFNVLNPAECISAEQALIAMTYDAAWQCNADQWTGSLAAGNFADFVILNQDPLTIEKPFMRMRNIEVLETWVAGEKVYSKG